MGGRPWNSSERKAILRWWGAIDISIIAKRIDRTPKAVETQARLMKLGSERETETIQQFSKRTGYNTDQIRTAAKALGLDLHRKPRVSVPRKGLLLVRTGKGAGAARAITEEQGDKILLWLQEQLSHCWRLQSGGKVREGAWGVGHKPPACIVCGTDERPHAAKGMCGRCYDHHRNTTPEARVKHKYRSREVRAWKKAGKPGMPPMQEWFRYME